MVINDSQYWNDKVQKQSQQARFVNIELKLKKDQPFYDSQPCQNDDVRVECDIFDQLWKICIGIH